MLVLLIFSVLVLMILLGFPIAVAMGLTAIGFFLGLGEPRMIGAMAQRMYSAVSSFPLLAIPFFILAGNLMNTGGMTDRIFGFARTLVGHVRGGLAHVSVLASMLFAGVSGAALAEAMGLGLIEIKAMKDGGFDKKFAGAVVASSSTIGPVIPPSIPMVIYGALAEVSVGKLFLGGVIPGVMMGVGIMVVIYILSVKRGYRAEQRATLAQVARSGIDGILGLLAPGIIMGGILGGVFTPTEAAVAAVIYALAVGCLVYRELDLESLAQDSLGHRRPDRARDVHHRRRRHVRLALDLYPRAAGDRRRLDRADVEPGGHPADLQRHPAGARLFHGGHRHHAAHRADLRAGAGEVRHRSRFISAW